VNNRSKSYDIMHPHSNRVVVMSAQLSVVPFFVSGLTMLTSIIHYAVVQFNLACWE
jgi:hypothetical protein